MSFDQFAYFDYAAATPLAADALAAMQPFFSEQFYNPSATYLPAVQVHRALDEARARVAHWLGSRPSEVIFTAGGTEANNLAIHGVMQQFPNGNIVISAIEHDSVRMPAQRYDCREAPVAPDGRVQLDSLKAHIDDNTVLVSVMYANNEVGTVQPIREIAQLVQTIRAQRGPQGLPIYVHTDACQAGNYLDIHVARLGVDLLTVNGGKIYGPKQSGALYVHAGTTLLPMLTGGGQERGLRSGTENVAQAVGLSVALDSAQTQRKAEAQRLQKLQAHCFDFVSTQLPHVVINGSRKTRLPNNVHITVPNVDNERLLLQLEQEGILAAAGSACSASKDEPSQVLQAMGVSEADAQSSIRITMGRDTTEAHVVQLCAALQRLCAQQK